MPWHSFEGVEIEGWLYLPVLAGHTKAPLILEIHGGPSLAWGDSYVHEFQVLAGKGYAVLAANPRGSTGYGEAFCQKSLHDWGGNDFRDLMAGIDHVITTEPVDGTRLGIGGLSYGGSAHHPALPHTQPSPPPRRRPRNSNPPPATPPSNPPPPLYYSSY